MRRNRRGFTMIEMLAVLLIASVVMMIAFPRARRTLDATSVRSAKQEVASYLTRTRAAAVQMGRPATFYFVSDKIWAKVDSANGTANGTLLRTMDIMKENGVELDGTASSIVPGTGANAGVVYDTRGYSSGAANRYIVLKRGTVRDSVCINSLGRISAQGCMP